MGERESGRDFPHGLTANTSAVDKCTHGMYSYVTSVTMAAVITLNKAPAYTHISIRGGAHFVHPPVITGRRHGGCTRGCGHTRQGRSRLEGGARAA